MTNPVTVGELLKFDDQSFDPMKLDTSEIKVLSEAMPKDGNIDVNNAEVLATKYLRGADLCGEFMALSIAYMLKTKNAKQFAYNYAFLIKSESNERLKTDKMRISFAELDEDYLQACEDYSKAILFAKWIESKHNIFNKMHYMCKTIIKRGYEQEQASSWNGSVIEEEDDNW